MSTDDHSTIAGRELLGIIRELEAEEAAIRDHNKVKSDIIKEAGNKGYDKKTIRKVMAARRLDPLERDEQDNLFDMYMHAVETAEKEVAHARVENAGKFGAAKPVTDTQEQPIDPATQSGLTGEVRTEAGGQSDAGTPDQFSNEYAGTSSDENPAPIPNPQPAASLGADKAGDVPPPEWRPVEEYEGLYEVSDTGLVRNANTGNLLSQFQTDGGYFIVKLFRDNVGKNHKVHRLVATAFIRPPVEDEEVNHIDFDKAHNVASNLEWVTSQENIAHFLDANPGFNTQNRGFSEDQVHSIRLRVASGESKRSIARDLSVAKATIDALIAGQTYSGVSPATLSEADVPAFLKPEQRKTVADYRPECKHPDACWSSNPLDHCYTCREAMEAASETEAA